MASSASLLSTTTTSSSFDPMKSDKTRHARGQKDYAAALSMLQSQYGHHRSSALSSAIIPPSSKKSPTPKPYSDPAMSPETTSPSPFTTAPSFTNRPKEAGSKRKQSCPLYMLWAKYHPRCWLAPSSTRPFSALPEGEAQEANNDGIGKGR